MRAVNLIPADQRSGASIGAGSSEGAAYAVIAVVGGIALLAFLYARADHQISSRRSQASTLAAETQRAQAEASQLAPYTSFAQLRQQRMAAVSQLVDSRFDWAHVFHEFGRVLPPEVSISSLTGAVGTASTGSASAAAPAAPAAAAPAAGAASSTAPSTSTVTSATPPGSVPLFTLTGCATSQPAVALMLDRLRLIDGVSDVTLQSSTKSAAGGASGGGGCVAGEPAFTVQVAFNPLPATTAGTGGATSAVSAASTGGA